MSVFKDSLWQEIKDGKSEWFVAERTPEACDLFEVQVVEPLRQLRDDGRIAIHENPPQRRASIGLFTYSFERFLRFDRLSRASRKQIAGMQSNYD
jgi:hypothetical protein